MRVRSRDGKAPRRLGFCSVAKFQFNRKRLRFCWKRSPRNRRNRPRIDRKKYFVFDLFQVPAGRSRSGRVCQEAEALRANCASRDEWRMIWRDIFAEEKSTRQGIHEVSPLFSRKWRFRKLSQVVLILYHIVPNRQCDPSSDSSIKQEKLFFQLIFFWKIANFFSVVDCSSCPKHCSGRLFS